MRVELRLARSAGRRWHVDLARRLATSGATVTVALADAGPPPASARRPDGYRALLRTERLVHRARPALAAPCPDRAFGQWPDGADAADLVLDLDGAPAPGSWALTFDGVPGTGGALAAVVDGRFPVLALARGRDVHPLGRPGSEGLRPVTTALDDVLAGTLVLAEQAVRAGLPAANGAPLAQPARPQPPRPQPPRPQPPGPVTIARGVAAAGVRRAYRAAYRAPHWRVGWRLLEAGQPDVLDLLGHPDGGWSTLPDDGLHFYADPFPVAHGEQHLLFVEDYDHRLARGVISVAEVGEHGPLGVPRPVLEHDVHLSYPYVLHDDGEWWMIPETSAAGTVELYRARSFPDRWTREAVLLRGVEASDTSVVRHGGRWWLFATVRDGGAFSDALHLWSAERLTGPWRAHPRNPVLVDISAARPAGRPAHRDGRLLRPVQDGSTGYGGSVAIAEVTRLDEDGFAQRVVGELRPGAPWPGTRLHTLNRDGRLECIDGSARSPRWRPALG